MSKALLSLNGNSAKKFFMKAENYCSIDLPPYYNFNNVLTQADTKLKTADLSSFIKPGMKIKELEDVNYKIYSNKDGNFAWRPLEIIHPFLYVNLVNKITENTNWTTIKTRFKEFKKDKHIICCSDIRINEKNKKQNATNVNYWWREFEQQSISLFLEYSLMAITDISGCYESIYTHSIAWALHGKTVAKQNRSNYSLIGNAIDVEIQKMRYGQTNGIPQGSTLMDFIAEIILGYADKLLSENLKDKNISDYKILRYRDDYRIFANSEETLNLILKELSSVLLNLNMKLNSNKTLMTNDIITSSVKPDKLCWLNIKNSFEQENNLQKKLYLLKSFSDKYTNSGQLKVALTELSKTDFKNYKYEIKNNLNTICAILCSIWLKNPTAYAQLATIFSKLFDLVENTSKLKKIMTQLLKKFKVSPNNTYFEIWIQRALIKFIDISKERKFESKLARMVYSPITLWNSSWIKDGEFIETIIDQSALQSLGKIISFEEYCLFNDYDGGF